MKLVAITLAVLTMALTACTGNNPPSEQVSQVEEVTMSVTNEICFEIDKALKESSKEQGLDENHFHNSECGTAEQQQAYNAGQYKVV